MIKSTIINTDELFDKEEDVFVGRTILTIVLNETGMTGSIKGYVTKDLLKALRRDVPKVIDKLEKEIK